MLLLCGHCRSFRIGGRYCPGVSAQISFNWLSKIFTDAWTQSQLVKSKLYLSQCSQWSQSQTLSEQSNSIYPVRARIRRVLIRGAIRREGLATSVVHHCQTYPRCDKVQLICGTPLQKTQSSVIRAGQEREDLTKLNQQHSAKCT